MFRDSDNILASALGLYKSVGSTPIFSISTKARDNERESSERISAGSFVIRRGPKSTRLKIDLTASAYAGGNAIDTFARFHLGVDDVPRLLDLASDVRIRR
jgi:hypothetical protein